MNDHAGEAIRVLVLLEAYTISGSAKGVLEFARESIRYPAPQPKVEISLITFRRPPTSEQPVLRNAIQELGIAWDAVEEQGRFDRSVIPHLRLLAQKRNPHIVWSNSVKSHFLVRYAGLNRARGWVAFHHGYTATDTKMLLYNQLDRWSLRAADRVLTVCRPFAAQVQAMGIDAKKIHVQHMPARAAGTVAGSETAALRTAWKLDGAGRIILTIGRLSREKGHADLLRAFQRLRRMHDQPLHLLIVGEGPERPHLEALCRDLQLTGSVTLTGHQNHLWPFYALADLFVLPSHSEGSPNVLLEAMAANVPVVATRVGGVPELATDGRDALLVEKSACEPMALAMKRLLSNRDLRAALTSSAHGVLERNTPEAYYHSIARVLGEILREKYPHRGEAV
ncbi:MAG: glycosyltransferase [Bryobacterales bacterium]|nr:glycosyltransferase [Bryobacterales bacterium]